MQAADKESRQKAWAHERKGGANMTDAARVIKNMTSCTIMDYFDAGRHLFLE